MHLHLHLSYLALKDNKLNNFDVIRFLLSMTVFLIHAAFLSQSIFLKPIEFFLSPEIAVESFFIVSGFLIFMSYENSSNIKTYLLKRIKRIYPGYITVIFLSTAFIFYSNPDFYNIYFMQSTFKYFITNSFFLNFLQPEVAGVFQNNHSKAINGALWTLKIEVMFYLIVPFIAIFLKRFNTALILCLIYLLSLFYSYWIGNLMESGYLNSTSQLNHQLPAQLVYFSAGALFFYYFAFFRKYLFVFLLVALAIFFFKNVEFFRLLFPLALGCVIIACATLMPYLGKFSKFGDLSYGVYIIHFPVIQYFISIGIYKDSAIWGFTLSVITVLFLAFVLWHFVEKPFLNRSSHYLK